MKLYSGIIKLLKINLLTLGTDVVFLLFFLIYQMSNDGYISQNKCNMYYNFKNTETKKN